MLARRYGVLPSKFLECDLNAHQFNLLVYLKGVEEETKQAMKARGKQGRGK